MSTIIFSSLQSCQGNWRRHQEHRSSYSGAHQGRFYLVVVFVTEVIWALSKKGQEKCNALPYAKLSQFLLNCRLGTSWDSSFIFINNIWQIFLLGMYLIPFELFYALTCTTTLWQWVPQPSCVQTKNSFLASFIFFLLRFLKLPTFCALRSTAQASCIFSLSFMILYALNRFSLSCFYSRLQWIILFNFSP